VQALHVAEDSTGPHEDPFPFGGKALEPLASLDDQHAQLLLEVLDAGGERGLRHLTGRRRAREMPLNRQGEEIPEIAGKHVSALEVAYEQFECFAVDAPVTRLPFLALDHEA